MSENFTKMAEIKESQGILVMRNESCGTSFITVSILPLQKQFLSYLSLIYFSTKHQTYWIAFDSEKVLFIRLLLC